MSQFFLTGVAPDLKYYKKMFQRLFFQGSATVLGLPVVRDVQGGERVFVIEFVTVFVTVFVIFFSEPQATINFLIPMVF